MALAQATLTRCCMASCSTSWPAGTLNSCLIRFLESTGWIAVTSRNALRRVERTTEKNP